MEAIKSQIGSSQVGVADQNDRGQLWGAPALLEGCPASSGHPSDMWGESHLVNLPPQSRGGNVLSQTLLRLGCCLVTEPIQLDIYRGCRAKGAPRASRRPVGPPMGSRWGGQLAVQRVATAGTLRPYGQHHRGELHPEPVMGSVGAPECWKSESFGWMLFSEEGRWAEFTSLQLIIICN